MENLNININLLKLSRAGVATIRGLKCVIIPIEENDIFVSTAQDTGKAKGAYLNMTAWKNKEGVSQYGDSHYVKQSYSSDYRQEHPDASQNSPILGNGRPVQIQGVSGVKAPNVDNYLDNDNDDDLPF